MTETTQNDTDDLLRRVAQGDGSAATPLLGKYRDRLRNLIRLRLDARLSARVDPSDVIQEAMVDAHRQLSQFAIERPLPFYPWLRQVTLSRLAQVHRFHLQAQRRSAHREAEEFSVLDQSSAELAKRLVSSVSTPSEIVRHKEEHHQLEEAILKLSETDREVLVLRYLEQLPTVEAAAVLDVTPNTFAQQHLRAVRRLRGIVERSDRS